MSTTLIIIKGFFERKKNVGIKTWTGGGGGCECDSYPLRRK
jgi:hypothetical protein